jgi:hypothetical protein
MKSKEIGIFIIISFLSIMQMICHAETYVLIMQLSVGRDETEVQKRKAIKSLEIKRK